MKTELTGLEISEMSSENSVSTLRLCASAVKK
jgi:hypothetical protein